MSGKLDFSFGVFEAPYFTLESLARQETVTFEVLRTRLIQHVKLRINSGEFTERSLARILGVSQSQLHNVLKGARQLQFYLADRLLAKLGISTLNLASDEEVDTEALRRKMSEWDRQLALGEDESADFGLDTMMGRPRKPVGRSSTNRQDCDFSAERLG